MYRHPQTEEGQYPRTVREVLHHSFTMLCEEFPERTVARKQRENGWLPSVSAYSWPGAGSEKGGSAEHIRYEKIVFLPEKNEKVAVVSVGDRQFDSMHTILIGNDASDLVEYDTCSGGVPSYYSVLFSYHVSPKFAEKFLDVYQIIKDTEKHLSSFDYVLEDVLEQGTRHFFGVPLFAVDVEEERRGSGKFYITPYGYVPDFSRNYLQELSNSPWNWYLHGDLSSRENLARFIAGYLQGKVLDASCVDIRFLKKQNHDFLHELVEKEILSRLEKV